MLEIIFGVILIVIVAIIVYHIIKGMFKFALIGFIILVIISILSGLILKGQIDKLAEEEEFYVMFKQANNFSYGFLFASEMIPMECELIDNLRTIYDSQTEIDRPLLIFDIEPKLELMTVEINGYQFTDSQKMTILSSNNPTNMINTILEDEGFNTIEEGLDNCILKMLFLNFDEMNKSEILEQNFELYPGNMWINLFNKIPIEFVKKNMLKVANYIARNEIKINSTQINETLNKTASKFDVLKGFFDKTN